MQTETMNTEPAFNGHTAGSIDTKSAAPDVAPPSVTREFQNFVADLEDLIKATTSLAGDDLARAKADLYARVAAAKAYVEQLPGAISDRARNTLKVADGYVREQPWQVIGISSAVGVLIGFLIGRRAQR